MNVKNEMIVIINIDDNNNENNEIMININVLLNNDEKWKL